MHRCTQGGGGEGGRGTGKYRTPQANVITLVNKNESLDPPLGILAKT
jgi:hypothetical protein